jgi:hypothetical protein
MPQASRKKSRHKNPVGAPDAAPANQLRSQSSKRPAHQANPQGCRASAGGCSFQWRNPALSYRRSSADPNVLFVGREAGWQRFVAIECLGSVGWNSTRHVRVIFCNAFLKHEDRLCARSFFHLTLACGTDLLNRFTTGVYGYLETAQSHHYSRCCRSRPAFAHRCLPILESEHGLA